MGKFPTLARVLRVAERRLLQRAQQRSLDARKPVPFVHQGHRYYSNPEPVALHHIAESVPKIQNLVDILPAGPRVALDVGANCGLFAAFLLRRFDDVVVHCFEPTPELIPLIHRNCQGRARANECAVGETDGTCEFYVNLNSQQTNSTVFQAVELFADAATITTRSVTQRSIDSYCHEFGIEQISVLKIDVQGAEGAVLRGAREMLPKTDIVLIEFTWIDLDAAHNLLPFAAEYGFDHLAAVNSIYTGADIALSRGPLPQLPGLLRMPRHAMRESVPTKPWF